MFDVGGGELVLILLVVLLLFGPKSIPDLARTVGKGLRQVRKAQEDLTQQIRDISAEAEQPAAKLKADLNKSIYTPAASTTPRSAEPEPPATPSTPSE
jgi:TatA/E family protein of Tat protein translocase